MATTGAFDKGWFKITLANTGAAAADMASVLNPEGVALVITRAVLNITTASTGASTIDAGVGSSASTLYDTLIDGRSGATAGVFDNVEDAGTNGEFTLLWPADQYVTVSEASGDVAGLAGELWLQYYPRA